MKKKYRDLKIPKRVPGTPGLIQPIWQKGKVMREKRVVVSGNAEEFSQMIGFDVNDLLNWDFAKDHLVPRLTDVNETTYLQDKPHKMIADIPVMYEVIISDRDGRRASAPVRQSLLDKWGKTIDEVDEVARGNIDAELIPLGELMGLLGDPVDTSDGPTVLVLTNKRGVHGASSILDKDLMTAICEKLGGDVMVLPSSIHEVMITPRDDESAMGYAEMIRKINAAVVGEDDKLSDELYIYSPESGLRVA